MRYSFSSIEPLEPRIAPAALTAKLLGGLLKVAGDPVSGSLIVKQTGSSIEVFDDVTSLGVFSGVKSIDLRPTGGVGVALYLAGDGLPGPCKITAAGPATVLVAPSSNLNGGLKFIGDSATQSLNLLDSVTVGKALIFKGGEGNDELSFQNAATIGGNLALTLIENVIFNGQNENLPASIGGNFTVSNAGDTIGCSISMTKLSNAVIVDGGFTYIGGKSNDSINLTASITKSVTFVDRVGNNQFALFSGSVVKGSVTMTGGVGNDVLAISSVRIDGDLTVNLGNGNNNFLYGSVNVASIGGNLTVTGGSGSDYVDGLSMNVTKNVSLRLGDGTNTVSGEFNVFGAKFLITTGSGVDLVNCSGAATSVAALVSLGDGADTLDSALFRTVKSANFQGGGGIDVYSAGTFVADPIVVRSFETFL